MTNPLTPSARRDFPAGTVTFLFTAIEGSTTLAQQYPAARLALRQRRRAGLPIDQRVAPKVLQFIPEQQVYQTW